MQEDYIDFPCSADWLDFYHKQGLTPRSSGRPDSIQQLYHKVSDLERKFSDLVELVRELLVAWGATQPKPDPFEDPPPVQDFDPVPKELNSTAREEQEPKQDSQKEPRREDLEWLIRN